MNEKNLIPGNEYLYTAGMNTIRVLFLHRTLNGYLFDDGKMKNELSKRTVNTYIKEI